MTKTSILIICGLITIFALSIFYFGVTDGTVKNTPVKANKPINDDSFELLSPDPGASVKSPIKVSGRARGIWFFEGSFPVIVSDSNNKIIGRGFVTAGSNWMTNELIPFNGEIVISKPETRGGVIIFKKDNPSGLPENDKEIKVPVLFK